MCSICVPIIPSKNGSNMSRYSKTVVSSHFHPGPKPIKNPPASLIAVCFTHLFWGRGKPSNYLFQHHGTPRAWAVSTWIKLHHMESLSPIMQLVGGWTNPFEKHARQIGSCPQGSGVKIIKKSLKPSPRAMNPFMRPIGKSCFGWPLGALKQP